MGIDLEKFEEIEAYLTEVQKELEPLKDDGKVYGRLDGAIGPLRAIIRDEEARLAHEEQRAHDEEELVQFVRDVNGFSDEFAAELLAADRAAWVERKRKVWRKAQRALLKQQGYNVMSHEDMDANCDYVSHDGTRYGGIDWMHWYGIKDEKFPMKELRNYKTHPVQYVDGVDING